MKLNEVFPDKDLIGAVRSAMRTYTRIEPYLNPCSHDHGIAMVIGAIRLGWRTHDRIVNGICSMGSDVYLSGSRPVEPGSQSPPLLAIQGPERKLVQRRGRPELPL